MQCFCPKIVVRPSWRAQYPKLPLPQRVEPVSDHQKREIRPFWPSNRKIIAQLSLKQGQLGGARGWPWAQITPERPEIRVPQIALKSRAEQLEIAPDRVFGMNSAPLDLYAIGFRSLVAAPTTPQPIFHYIRHFGRFMYKIATTAKKAQNDLFFVFNQSPRIPTHRPLV